ncbi:uncharacterized protein LOC135367605 [Ornithodoros turicata]|uniref:uncharacterized protein LOC135367605 n=1 Tax=Ornithodoros turicata TaxID=34597 RepID=UPI00313985D8
MDIPSARELLDRFTYYDYAVFIGMLSISGAIGVFCAFHGGAQNTIRQLLTGNRALPVVPVGTSLMASFISAAYILGSASEVYRNGTMYAMMFLSYAITIPVTAHLYMPVFYNLNVITAYEYLELRFNRQVRMITVALYTIEMTIYIAISLYAPALALSQLTGMTLWSAVAAIGIVCTVYTSIGGIKAVVYTDTFQTVVTVVALAVVVLIGYSEMGGFFRVWEIARNGSRIEFDNINLDPTIRHTIWGLSLGGFFTSAASYATSQMMVLRYLTVPSLRDAKIVIWLNFPFLCVVLFLSCLAGLMVYARYATCDPIEIGQVNSNDQLLPYFVMDVLGKMTGVPGLFVAGIFAASLSSISSGVNALASVFYVDVIALIKEDIPDKIGARIINGLGVFFGLLSIGLVALASQMGNVLSASLSINSGIGGPLLGVFTLGIFVPSANSKGALSGLLVSLALSLWMSLGSFLEGTEASTTALVSVDGCLQYFQNFTSVRPASSVAHTAHVLTGVLNLYKLSYLWYSMIAFFFVFIVGVPVSHITGPTRPETLNPELLTPWVDTVLWFLPEEVRKFLRSDVGSKYVPDITSPSANSKTSSFTKEVLGVDFLRKESLSPVSPVLDASYIRNVTDISFPVPPPMRKLSYHPGIVTKLTTVISNKENDEVDVVAFVCFERSAEGSSTCMAPQEVVEFVEVVANADGGSAHLAARFTEWDYMVFAGMLCISAAIGLYYACSGSKQATTAEFLMGNRNMQVIPVALSILASFMSAITLLGTAAEMYNYGTQYIFILFAYCLVIPAAAYLYMPVFYELHLTSTYEYLELRFHHSLRALGCLIFAFQMLIYMAIVLYAPSLALSQVTGISVWTSVLSIGIICTFYTSIGGIKAVIWTDVFQILLMFGSMLTVTIKGSLELGGFNYVIEKARDGNRLEFFNFSFDPTVRHTVWGLIIGCYFTWQFVYGVSQAMVQRYLTLPSLGKAKLAIWLNLPGLSFLMLICSMSGLVIYAKYSACDPKLTKRITSDDQLLPLYVMEILGGYPGIPGLFVAGIFSGALSTVSSGVNSLAAVALEDVVKRYINPGITDAVATTLSKGLALCLGLISILMVIVAQSLGGVLQAALSIFGMIGGPLLGVFTLGLFFPCANSFGAMTGLLGSLAFSMWIGFGAFITKPLIPRAPISVLGCIDEYLNVTNTTMFSMPKQPDYSKNEDTFILYRLSYVWFSMIGCWLVVFIGLLMSFITGCTKPSAVDPRTVHPIYNYMCRKLLPSRLHEKFLTKPTEQYLTEHLVALARSPAHQGKDNFAYLATTEGEKGPFFDSIRAPSFESLAAKSSAETVAGAQLKSSDTQAAKAPSEDVGRTEPNTFESLPGTSSAEGLAASQPKTIASQPDVTPGLGVARAEPKSVESLVGTSSSEQPKLEQKLEPRDPATIKASEAGTAIPNAELAEAPKEVT